MHIIDSLAFSPGWPPSPTVTRTGTSDARMPSNDFPFQISSSPPWIQFHFTGGDEFVPEEIFSLWDNGPQITGCLLFRRLLHTRPDLSVFGLDTWIITQCRKTATFLFSTNGLPLVPTRTGNIHHPDLACDSSASNAAKWWWIRRKRAGFLLHLLKRSHIGAKRNWGVLSDIRCLLDVL